MYGSYSDLRGWLTAAWFYPVSWVLVPSKSQAPAHISSDVTTKIFY